MDALRKPLQLIRGKRFRPEIHHHRILTSVGLEVLGLGPQNVPTIGRTLYYAFKYTALFRGMWWWWAPPVLTLAIIFTGLFQVSTSLDKYANPRLKNSAGG